MASLTRHISVPSSSNSSGSTVRHRRCNSYAQVAVQTSPMVSKLLRYCLFVQYMYAAVYRLRERGVRLPKPKDPVSGQLRLQPHQVGTNDPHALLAELVGDGGRIAVPQLHGAIVRRVTSGGMVIRGTEILSRGGSKGRVEKFRQTWWCLVLTEAVIQEVFDLSPVGRE